MKLVNAHVHSGGEILANLQADNEQQRQANSEAKATHRDILQTVSVTATVLKAFVDYQSGAEKEYTRRLEIENAVMRRQLDAKDVEIARQFAEIDGLRDSLSRLIIRTDVENDVLRRDVKAQIERNAADIETMKKVLQQRIDDSVLAIHKPQFQSSVKALKSIVEEEQFKVQQSADELRFLIDQIGAENRFLPRQLMTEAQRQLDAKRAPLKQITDGSSKGTADALSAEELAEYAISSSMHTNFPRNYREELAKCRKDVLLTILDAISFEPRVVTAVGQALASLAAEREVAEMGAEEEVEADEPSAEVQPADDEVINGIAQ